MCWTGSPSGPKTPAAPVTKAEETTPVDTTDTVSQKDDAKKARRQIEVEDQKRRRAKDRKSTILTGPLGLTTSAKTATMLMA